MSAGSKGPMGCSVLTALPLRLRLILLHMQQLLQHALQVLVSPPDSAAALSALFIDFLKKLGWSFCAEGEAEVLHVPVQLVIMCVCLTCPR